MAQASKDSVAAPSHSVEIDAATCTHCGALIVQRYAGTFWKPPAPMPMIWVHLQTDDKACGYATPRITPPARTVESDAVRVAVRAALALYARDGDGGLASRPLDDHIDRMADAVVAELGSITPPGSGHVGGGAS